jgi:hypothetical protein
MTEYMLVVTDSAGHQAASHAEFVDDSAAIETAGRSVSAERPVVVVSRGAAADATVLGAWEFENGDGYWWPEP